MMVSKLKHLLGVVLLFTVLILPQSVFAQMGEAPIQPDKKYEGKITKVVGEKKIKLFDKEQPFQELEIELTSGDKSGQKIVIDNSALPALSSVRYSKGDQVIVAYLKNPDGGDVYYIVDYLRRDALFWLFAIFAVLVLLVSREKGFWSLVGMGFTFLIIFVWIVPQISNGQNPVLIAILGSAIIVPVTFYLSHGLNRKTTAAVIGTTISLIITGILSTIAISTAKLSGYANEQAGFIQSIKGGTFDIQGLLLAGIIISVLGILDDVTVTQSSVVQELKKANEKLNLAQLYFRAMSVGRDHIASVVNTLVIVYVGASLPLLILFVNNPAPFTEVINYEVIAEEVIRTLVSSIGLVLSIPITTLLAAWIFSRRK